MHEVVSVISENVTIKIILASIWTGISFFAGTYVGHRFNLFRDKRKEFNEIADKINLHILRIVREIDSGYYPSSSIKQEDIDLLIINSKRKESRKITKTYNDYISIHRHNMLASIPDEEISNSRLAMKEELTKLFEFIKHK